MLNLLPSDLPKRVFERNGYKKSLKSEVRTRIKKTKNGVKQCLKTHAGKLKQIQKLLPNGTQKMEGCPGKRGAKVLMDSFVTQTAL